MSPEVQSARSKGAKDPSERPRVSIVIPTYRRERELKRLVESIPRSEYPSHRIEVIVVDDGGTLERTELPDEEFERLVLISNDRERLVSECRNLGLEAATTDFVFYVDDDNVIGRRCIGPLVDRLMEREHLGAVTPFQYYLAEPDRVWCGGTLRNPITSTTTIICGEEVDPQRNAPREVDDAPNAFMVRRSVAVDVGGFDSAEFPTGFEHSDFFERMKDDGFGLEVVPAAVCYHDTPRDKTSQFGNEMKMYYYSRNRVLFQKRHVHAVYVLLFIILLPAIAAVYAWRLYQTRNEDNIPILVQGFVDGILGKHDHQYLPESTILMPVGTR